MDQALASTFVGVIEPYVGQRKIRGIRRLDANNAHSPIAALEITFTDGRCDVIVYGGRWKGGDVEVRGSGALIRFDASGQVSRIINLRATHVAAGDVAMNLEQYTNALEVSLDRTRKDVRASVLTTDRSERYGIESLAVAGANLGQID